MMHEYFVSNNRKLTSTTLLLTLKKNQETSRPFSFQPGQYAAICFKRRHRPTPARCFSIVSSPTDQEILQFSVRTKGHFTKALTDLRKGDEVKVRGPFGGFVFDAQRDTDTVLLAGGIGIAPFMSMIQYAADTNLTNNITLLFSCQNQDDIPFAERLKKLEKRNPHFKTIFVIGEGPTDKFAGHQVVTGRITSEIIDQIASGTYDRKSFFICGPPSFMKAMTKVLRGKEASGNKIMTEAFGQGPNRQTGKIRSWPLNIYILSAAGVVAGSFVVMVSDLLKTLPPSSILNSSSTTRLSSLTNSRQTDLDKLVNGLPDVVSTSPATNAVNKAIQESNVVTSTPAPIIPPTSRAKAAPQTTTTPTPTVATPVPTPTPKCTTSQSGVKTCV